MNRVNPSFMVGAQTLKNPWFKIKILETCSCHRNDLHRLKYRYHSRGIKGSKLGNMYACFYNEFYFAFVRESKAFFFYILLTQLNQVNET